MSLSRLTHWKQATGVAVGDGRAVAVTMAALPGAPTEVRSAEAPIGEGGVAEALRSLHESGALAGFVAVGLDPRSAFFMTRERQGGGDLDPTAMLDAYFAASRPDGGLVADAIPVGLRGGNYVALAACRRDAAVQVHDGLSKIPHTRRALEPTPFALFRVAHRAAPAPRAWKACIRVIVDGTHGLAMLQRGKALLAWRPFTAAAMHELDGIAGSVRGLVAHARADLGVATIDGVVLHGSEKLALVADQAGSVCGIPFRLVAPIGLDERSVARGLALGALGVGVSAPNLLKQLRPPLTVRETFPWATTAALVTIAVGSWRTLASSTAAYEYRISHAQSRTAAAMKSARVKASDLKPARKAALHESVLVSRFLANRVPWAALLRELPAHLPDSTVLFGMMGHDQLILPSIDKPDEKANVQREISIQGQVRIARDETASDDVKTLLGGIMEFPLLLSIFPRVDGAEITRHAQKGQDAASFIIRCGVSVVRKP